MTLESKSTETHPCIRYPSGPVWAQVGGINMCEGKVLSDHHVLNTWANAVPAALGLGLTRAQQ